MNIPEGWKLVPVEPTDEMLDAAARASMQHLIDCIRDPEQAKELGSEKSVRLTYGSRYRAMLAAAPTPPAPVSMPEPLTNAEIDAARYRLLRRKFAIISDGNGNAEFCPINLPRPTYIAPNTAIELDTALDRERLGIDGVEAETLRRIKEANK